MGSGGRGSEGEGGFGLVGPHATGWRKFKSAWSRPRPTPGPCKQIRLPGSPRQLHRDGCTNTDQCNAWTRTLEPDFLWTICEENPQIQKSLLFVSEYTIEAFAEKFLNLETMIAMLSFACLTCGVGLAGLSMRDARRAPILERWSGICLLAGLVLLGGALPLFR